MILDFVGSADYQMFGYGFFCDFTVIGKIDANGTNISIVI
jgi:hypothetical protein